jgi:serine/threonine protein kinase
MTLKREHHDDLEKAVTLVLDSAEPETIEPPVLHLVWEDLFIGRRIGKGGFCSVFHVSICPDDNLDARERVRQASRHYALKYANDKDSQDTAADLRVEAKLLSTLHHTNIISLHGSNVDVQPFLVLDLLCTTLDRKMLFWRDAHRSNKRRLFRKQPQDHKFLLERVESTAIGISRGMEYLHSRHIIFRNLKPANSKRRWSDPTSADMPQAIAAHIFSTQ